MVSRHKIVLSVVMILLTALFVGLSLFSVFAAPEQNVGSEMTVEYVAPKNIDAKVKATYSYTTTSGGSATGTFAPVVTEGSDATIDGAYLKFTDQAKTANVGSLRLNSSVNFKNSVEIAFEFNNSTSDIPFKVSLNIGSSTNENMTLKYKTTGSYTTTIPTNVVVGAKSTVTIYVQLIPTSLLFNATFIPNMAWVITEYTT